MAFYGKQINGTWVTGQLHDLFPNVTSPSTEFLQEEKCLEVNAFKSFDSTKEKLITVTAYEEAGQLFIVEVKRLSKDELGALAIQARQVLVSQSTVISMRQARLALLKEDRLSVVDTSVATMTQEAQISWEYAVEVHITDPLVVEVQKALSWTDIQLEDLFIAAKAL